MGWGEASDYSAGPDARGGGGGKTGSNYDEEWVPFKQLMVARPPGLFGLVMGLLSLSPFVIIIGFLTLILFRRDLHTIFFLIGVVVNSMTNVVLKNLIAQERPPPNEHLRKFHGKNWDERGYGMPSHHTQFMWFFSFYMVLFLMFRVKSSLPKSSGDHEARQRWMYFLLALATAASYSRVYLGYHDAAQVVVGAICGILMASFWFYMVQHHFTPCFLKILCHPVAQFLMLRDTSLIPNIQMFEYCNIMEAVKHRTRGRPESTTKCLHQGSLFCNTGSDGGNKPTCRKHETCF